MLGSDIVILISTFAAKLETARQLGGELNGRIVVDISNPLNGTYDGLVTPPGALPAECIRDALPRVPASSRRSISPSHPRCWRVSSRTTCSTCSSPPAANAAVACIVRDGGLNPIDIGPLERARQLGALALLGITLQLRLGTGFGTAWRLVLATSS